MGTDQQNFNLIATPLFATLYLVIAAVSVGLITRGTNPRFSVEGKKDIFVKLLTGIAIIQIIFGYLMVFSANEYYGLFMMLIPFFAVFGLMTLDPYFLVLYVAIELYTLDHTAAMFSSLTAAGSCGLTGSNDFCKNGWRTFQLLLCLIYYFFQFLQAFGNFYLFSHVSFGADGLGSSASDNTVSAPLLQEPSPSDHAKRDAPF